MEPWRRPASRLSWLAPKHDLRCTSPFSTEQAPLSILHSPFFIPQRCRCRMQRPGLYRQSQADANGVPADVQVIGFV
jgi:hypothetical protein